MWKALTQLHCCEPRFYLNIILNWITFKPWRRGLTLFKLHQSPRTLSTMIHCLCFYVLLRVFCLAPLLRRDLVSSVWYLQVNVSAVKLTWSPEYDSGLWRNKLFWSGYRFSQLITLVPYLFLAFRENAANLYPSTLTDVCLSSHIQK